MRYHLSISKSTSFWRERVSRGNVAFIDPLGHLWLGFGVIPSLPLSATRRYTVTMQKLRSEIYKTILSERELRSGFYGTRIPNENFRNEISDLKFTK